MMAKRSEYTHPNLQFELELWEQGLRQVVGIDEAGRGALAGPVVVGAVCFPADPCLATPLHGVRDSKQLTPTERAYWAERIKAFALAWAVGFASNEEIDRLGIAKATRLAAQRALQGLLCRPQHLLIDYFRLPECALPQTALVKGDQRCLSIAAASILAKTERDRWMMAVDEKYPHYGFAAHKGYATALHLERIERWGACPIHRRSFAPLRSPIENKESV